MTRRGVLLGTLKGYYLTAAGDTHVGLFGETRSGKDAAHLLPTICLQTQDTADVIESLVMTDPKRGRTFAQTQAWRVRCSDIVVFDPLGPHSAGINVLDYVTDYRTAKAVAKSHVAPLEQVRETATSLHFRQLAEKLLTAGILHVLDERALSHSMGGVLAFFTLIHRSLPSALTAMLKATHRDRDTHEVISSIAREVSQIADRELSGLWTTMLNAIDLYRDPQIARQTNHSDVDLRAMQFGDRPMTLYLVAPSPKAALHYHQVYRVILETIFELSTNEALTIPRRPLLCCFNEFASYGYLPCVDQGSATLAEYGIRLFLIGQDLEQLWNTYGPGTQIWGNLRVKLFHGAANDKTAERISKMLDEQTIEREVVSWHGGLFGRRTITTQEHGRSLARPGEIGQWDPDRLIAIVSGHRPFNLAKVRWWQDPIFRQRVTDIPRDDVC